ncbi:cytidylyltransferase domain-containing protein [Psychrobacter sp. I-STPA6b]|uniref:acylneuraminate cytidylyltransferase family protein n=1 Tax=Psychrobacter sp. I-STPA6b TaxID=2585718 RepID=UPI001D0CCEF1|nr:acylneuraminate cytidylyltransferase family protein [Psychrobacter sp. I-STPA6b]
MKYIAVIPARGGSKGIRNKNLQLVGDKSLVARAILSAKDVEFISRVIVSTDSQAIEEEALKFGAEIHRRQAKTSSDHAKTIDVLEELYSDMGFNNEICVLLQPTSPLRESSHIEECIRAYEDNHSQGSVISTTLCEHHPYKAVIQMEDGSYIPSHYLSDLESPRQKLPKALRVNGAVYIISFKQLLEGNSFFCEPQKFIEMTEEESIDIDNYTDLEKANLLIKGKKL